MKARASVEWMLAWPDALDAGSSLLSAAHDRLDGWDAPVEGIGIDLPIPAFVGVPDVWPHMGELFETGGYSPDLTSSEAVYGGRLDQVLPPGPAPVEGLEIRRTMGKFGTRFAAMLREQDIGWCECYADLTRGGRLPTLSGWAELSEIETASEWRNRGIGSWVVKHTIDWLRLAGCDRCLFPVSPEDEKAGAGRFYGRFGWEPLVRELKWWPHRKA